MPDDIAGGAQVTGGAAAPPARPRGYDRSRMNAVRHGLWSKAPVLPFESAEEYEALVDHLCEEYGPRGPTEAHLVRELAHVIWRRRRLKWAEVEAANTHFLHLQRGREDWTPGMPPRPRPMIRDHQRLFRRINKTKARKPADTGGESGTSSPLAIGDYQNLDEVGRVLAPGDDRFDRIEAHLDRRFERTLATLIQLQNLRALDQEAESKPESSPKCASPDSKM